MATSTVERPFKHILVSVYYRGRLHWAVVAARKVGNRYEVTQEAVSTLTQAAGVHPWTSFTMG